MVETEMSSLLSPWLTPTCFFVLFNIVLGIILFLNSNNNNNNNNHTSKNQTNNNNNYNYDYRNQDDAVSLVPPPPQLTRAPSLFSRVSSFNFSQYYSEHVPTTHEVVENTTTTTLTRAPSLLYRVASFKFSWAAREGGEAEGKMVNDNNNDHHHLPKEEEVEVAKVKKVNNKKKKGKKEIVTEVKKETTTFRGKNEVVLSSDSKPKETTAYLSKVQNEETTAFKEEVKETTSSRGEDEQVDSKADDFINRFKQQLKMQRLESMIRNRTYIAAN